LVDTGRGPLKLRSLRSIEWRLGKISNLEAKQQSSPSAVVAFIGKYGVGETRQLMLVH
jgi:hypothetical protein